MATAWVVLGWWAYRQYGAGLRDLVGTPPWTPVQLWGMSLADPAPEPEHDLRADLLTEAARVRRVLQVLDGIGRAAELQPLRSALRDEVGASAQRVTEALARAHGREPTVRAVAALASTVEHDRSIALEMIEVTCGRSARLVLALVDPTLDEHERRTRLGDPRTAASRRLLRPHSGAGRRSRRLVGRACGCGSARSTPHPWSSEVRPRRLPVPGWTIRTRS